jgi:hypothetical protein
MKRTFFLIVAILHSHLACADLPWRQPTGREAKEEPAGSYVSVLAGPRIGGVSVGSGTWLRDTWILGDYEASTYWQSEEEALFASLGLILRVMPRTDVAPFLGFGGAYNQTISGQESGLEDGVEITRGRSHFSVITEAGVRIARDVGFWELSVRYAMLNVEAEGSDHLYGRIAYGVGLGR